MLPTIQLKDVYFDDFFEQVALFLIQKGIETPQVYYFSLETDDELKEEISFSKLKPRLEEFSENPDEYTHWGVEVPSLKCNFFFDGEHYYVQFPEYMHHEMEGFRELIEEP